MKGIFRRWMALAACVVSLGIAPAVGHADVYTDAGAAIGQAIANNMQNDPAKTISTYEYANESYDASNVKKIFLVCDIPQGFEQFIDSPYALAETAQVVSKDLTGKGFEVEDLNSVTTKISQAYNVNLADVYAQDPQKAVELLAAYAKENFDASCAVHIMSYRMIPGQASNRAEATLDIAFTDTKLILPIYAYRRQYIRANTFLAPNQPKDMVEKISKIFVKGFAKKVSSDKEKAGK